MGKKLEVHELPSEVLDKATIIGNVFHDLDVQKSKLEAIDDIVSGDWGYSVTDDMVNLPDGSYKTFTQKQAEEMATAIGRVYMIAHTIHCTACDAKWHRTSTPAKQRNTEASPTAAQGRKEG